MTIKEIRQISGLTQEKFAKKYEIPVHTIKGWESSATSSRHRECPLYVLKLLERVVNEDYMRKTIKEINLKEESRLWEENKTNILYHTTLPHVVGCKEVQS